jgi:hypothetical protein
VARSGWRRKWTWDWLLLPLRSLSPLWRRTPRLPRGVKTTLVPFLPIHQGLTTQRRSLLPSVQMMTTLLAGQAKAFAHVLIKTRKPGYGILWIFLTIT